jgi:hypothetical protein
MGVWDHLADFETIGRMLQHPAHPGVMSVVESLLGVVRAADDRSQLRMVQTDLFGYILDAERHYSEARKRVKKRQPGAELDETFWRRAIAQLKSVGDAIAWKFLGYDRRKILLLRTGDLAGHFSGKEGTNVEWALFNEHWDAGEPSLLTGLTTTIRYTDLLVDKGSGVLELVEAKKDLAKSRGPQKRRAKALVELLNTGAPYEGPTGPWQIVECSLPLKSYWQGAASSVERAAREGVSTYAPIPGLGALFLSPSALIGTTHDEAEKRFETERERAAEGMGRVIDGEHSILIHSTNYPYRLGPIAPPSIIPLPTPLAARIVAGDILYTVEVHPHRLVEALARRGISATVALPDDNGDLASGIDVLTFAKGEAKGTMHAQGVEPVGAELQDFDRWAEGVEVALNQESAGPKMGVYVAFDETDAWAYATLCRGEGSL